MDWPVRGWSPAVTTAVAGIAGTSVTPRDRGLRPRSYRTLDHPVSTALEPAKRRLRRTSKRPSSGREGVCKGNGDRAVREPKIFLCPRPVENGAVDRGEVTRCDVGSSVWLLRRPRRGKQTRDSAPPPPRGREQWAPACSTCRCSYPIKGLRHGVPIGHAGGAESGGGRAMGPPHFSSRPPHRRGEAADMAENRHPHR